MTTEKRMSEKQTVAIDTDKPPVGLHLKHADIAPPLTLICRSCGTKRLWTEWECSGCQLERTEQKRKRGIGGRFGSGQAMTTTKRRGYAAKDPEQHR